ncbi:hypothetical protein L3Q82_008088 [Scortum barcoo]|uniref:Uncharacterized protein n=1 Tax=Scortum barcoo TaxID=214431 RepID=A0ACB8WKW6_9TELE|nr:hypothetical protein L3Q82_008088 [Scortum barcoo]
MHYLWCLLPDVEKPKPPALPGKLPTILLASRKTSDATVQTEDFSNKINSSTSPTVETAPVISEEVPRLALLRKISATSGSNLQDGDSDVSLRSHSTISTGTSDSHVGGVVHFRQGSPSKAARVTPFNYTPSPMACSLQDSQCQAAAINKKSQEKTARPPLVAPPSVATAARELPVAARSAPGTDGTAGTASPRQCPGPESLRRVGAGRNRGQGPGVLFVTIDDLPSVYTELILTGRHGVTDTTNN